MTEQEMREFHTKLATQLMPCARCKQSRLCILVQHGLTGDDTRHPMFGGICQDCMFHICEHMEFIVQIKVIPMVCLN